MPAYNKERVSEEFRQLADLADAAFRANLRNLSADPEAVRAHDELLARADVYGYLYDRHFLASPELLLNELRWLRATNRPEVPRQALHPDRFTRRRTGLLDLLVDRFQALLDYRDSLDDASAPASEAAETGGKPAEVCANRRTTPPNPNKVSANPGAKHDVNDRLGKVIHVEGGYTVVEIVEDRPGQPGTLVGYSLFGLGTDIRKRYTREDAIAALRERVDTQNA